MKKVSRAAVLLSHLGSCSRALTVHEADKLQLTSITIRIQAIFTQAHHQADSLFWTCSFTVDSECVSEQFGVKMKMKTGVPRPPYADDIYINLTSTT